MGFPATENRVPIGAEVLGRRGTLESQQVEQRGLTGQIPEGQLEAAITESLAAGTSSSAFALSFSSSTPILPQPIAVLAKHANPEQAAGKYLSSQKSYYRIKKLHRQKETDLQISASMLCYTHPTTPTARWATQAHEFS